MVPGNGGARTRGIFGNQRGPADVGGECVGHYLVASRVLRVSDALNSGVETSREVYAPVCMTMGHIIPTKGAIGGLPVRRFVVWCKGDAGFIATRNGSSELRRKTKGFKR